MKVSTDHRALRASGLVFGFGRAEITVFEPGMSMWGWAAPNNVPCGAETPLFARALVLSEGTGGRPVAVVSLELGMVSESIRCAALAELAARDIDLDEHRLVLTATHTHSGPSGYSTYLFYALAGPGFSGTVHDTIVAGIVEAVEQAWARRAEGRVFVHELPVPLDEPVAFNRAVDAFNKNADVDPVRADRADEAVDRTMRVLRFEDAAGAPRGLVSVFAVHGTSVHGDGDRLHSDNKGVAARACERDPAVGGDFVALFLQGAAGDVSPNYRPSRARGFLVGRYDDDYESAAHNGELQARWAMRAFHAAREDGRELRGRIGARLRYAPLHETTIDPDLADGRDDRRTGPASLGLGFGLGTAEGPGPLRRVAGVTRSFSTLLGLRAATAGTDSADVHGRKVRMCDLGRGRENLVAGVLSANHALLGAFGNDRLRYYRAALASRGVQVLPWVPHNLPFQIVGIGDLALGLVPFEPTTQAGRRLAALLRAELGPAIRDVFLLGYANAYASYLTTPEEYDVQAYEGASTLFGRWTLAAVGTELRRVAAADRSGASPADIGSPPARVTIADWLPFTGPVKPFERPRFEEAATVHSLAARRRRESARTSPKRPARKGFA